MKITTRSLKKIIALVLIVLTLSFALPVASGQVRRHRRHRTFWQKHRDKLTVAGTTLGGAGIGGLAGGKKGALIGAAAGAGGGALYTYKLRKRHRHRRNY
jgi:outer membrane lipoprotein SlyB